MSKTKDKKPWIPFIETRVTLPILGSGRQIDIVKEHQISGQFESYRHRVNFVITWMVGDPRDKDILSGKSRTQNVIVEVKRVLIALKEMFPEYQINFRDATQRDSETTPEPTHD